MPKAGMIAIVAFWTALASFDSQKELCPATISRALGCDFLRQIPGIAEQPAQLGLRSVALPSGWTHVARPLSRATAEAVQRGLGPNERPAGFGARARHYRVPTLESGVKSRPAYGSGKATDMPQSAEGIVTKISLLVHLPASLPAA
jgi:hypothetical protein